MTEAYIVSKKNGKFRALKVHKKNGVYVKSDGKAIPTKDGKHAKIYTKARAEAKVKSLKAAKNPKLEYTSSSKVHSTSSGRRRSSSSHRRGSPGKGTTHRRTLNATRHHSKPKSKSKSKSRSRSGSKGKRGRPTHHKKHGYHTPKGVRRDSCRHSGKGNKKNPTKCYSVTPNCGIRKRSHSSSKWYYLSETSRHSKSVPKSVLHQRAKCRADKKGYKRREGRRRSSRSRSLRHKRRAHSKRSTRSRSRSRSSSHSKHHSHSKHYSTPVKRLHSHKAHKSDQRRATLASWFF